MFYDPILPTSHDPIYDPDFDNPEWDTFANSCFMTYAFT